MMDPTLDLNLSISPREATISIEQAPRELSGSGGTIISLDAKIPVSKEVGDLLADKLMEEVNRLSRENKVLTEMLISLCQDYAALQGQLKEMMQMDGGNNTGTRSSEKRKAEDDNPIGVSCCDGASYKRPREITTNISKIFARSHPSDTSLVVKDGYQWRKYGQKVTRDNPSPRAYYKCSFAPSCPVKKKVQRSLQDPWLLVATYEGQHNHLLPCPAEVSLGLTSAGSVSIATSSAASTSISIQPDKMHFAADGGAEEMFQGIFDVPSIKKFLINSLSRNPNFTKDIAQL
ncbi:hypothetical protein NMG60_11025926 [Bertholletia excelsa]